MHIWISFYAMSSIYPAALSLGVLSCLLSAQRLNVLGKCSSVTSPLLIKPRILFARNAWGLGWCVTIINQQPQPKKCTLKAREKFLLQRTPASTVMVTWPSKSIPTNEWPPLMRRDEHWRAPFLNMMGTGMTVCRLILLLWRTLILRTCCAQWCAQSFEQYAFKALTDYKTITKCSTKWCVLLKLFKTSCC